MLRLNQKGSSHLIVPVLAVLVIGVIGAKVLSASHADSPNTIITNNAAASSATLKNEAIQTAAQALGSSGAPSSAPYSFIGSQTVNDVSSGQTLTYSDGVKGTSVTSCYSFYVTQPKAGSITFPVEFTTNNNSITVNVTSTATDDLQQVCVAPGKQVNPGFSVKNLASSSVFPGNIEVLSDTLTW